MHLALKDTHLVFEIHSSQTGFQDFSFVSIWRPVTTSLVQSLVLQKQHIVFIILVVEVRLAPTV